MLIIWGVSSSKHALLNVYQLSLVRKDPPKSPGIVSGVRGGWYKYWHFVIFQNIFMINTSVHTNEVNFQ